MFLPPVVPGVPPGPQHHPTLPAGRGVTPRAPRHLCRHRNVVQSSNLSHHTHFGASLPLTSTPTVSCTTGASHQNLHVSDRRINLLIVARLPNRLPEGRLTKGVVSSHPGLNLARFYPKRRAQQGQLQLFKTGDIKPEN